MKPGVSLGVLVWFGVCVLVTCPLWIVFIWAMGRLLFHLRMWP